MEFFKQKTHIRFLEKTRYAVGFSLALIALTIGSLISHGGPKYGIDFTGGTVVQIRFITPIPVQALRDSMDRLGFRGSDIQEFGAPTDMLIRLPVNPEEQGDFSKSLAERLSQDFGENKFEVARVEMVGPKVGKDLREKAALSMLYAILGILIYVALRFDFRYAVGAVLPLVHDATITIGAFSILGKEFTLPVIAAILTVIGYSLNDTIVVFDRIRENMKFKRALTFEKLIDASINETLSRTILTSGLTLLVVVALFFLGGEVIHDFAFALIVGIVVGTYSSIYVASPIVLHWDKFISLLFKGKLGPAKR